MLQTLRARNLALVEDATIEFAPGFNVLTGETGAGKSIIVGALGLLLGERADKTLIRSGAEQCGAEAVFHLADSSALDALLEDHGLPPCERGQLIVRRIISANGAGRNLVNDSATTLQVLKELGRHLVDLHGPHDHQSLLDGAFQLELLDAFGRLWDRRCAYERVYEEYGDLEARKKALEGDDQALSAQMDLLAYQVKEIEEAAPVEGEDEEVEREHAEAANAQRILELASAARAALTDGEGAAFDALAAAQKALGDLAGLMEAAGAWRDEARVAALQIQELSAAIETHVRRIEDDPGRLRQLEERLAVYHRLKKKYGPTVRDVLAHLDRSRARLQDLQTRGERRAEIEARLAETMGRLRQLAERLREDRRKVCGRLGPAITAELRALGFPHGAFQAVIEEADLGPAGADRVEFGFAPNPGEPARPLRLIASSGEISRVMLAIKAVLADHDRIPLLVFDEIDANVGGEMGQAVGAKLAAVSRHHQVLCITHLPQVAAQAGTHFAVTKEVSGGRTRTRIRRLSGEERVEEIARMLGGRDSTSVALRHARELLRK